MRVTRSVSRALNAQTESDLVASTPAPKRKAASSRASSKKSRTEKPEATEEETQTNPSASSALPFKIPPRKSSSNDSDIVPAVLSFSFEDAKKHLISADSRFEHVFTQLKCKPFEDLERVHPFQALTKSILGQQISWMAARSINHKFVRLYNPTLPEKPSDVTTDMTDLFPTPEQVAQTDISILKTAGLSTRKAEYVQDLASRFADGRLSTSMLLEAGDDELADMLIQVRGIGRWTVDMFAIFSLRRPDILPVGDLGVQRGVARWFLALHSPTYNFTISPQKVTGGEKTPTADKAISKPIDDDDEDTLPVFGETNDTSTAPPADASSVPPGGVPATPLPDGSNKSMATLPPPLTPSTSKTLITAVSSPPPLPQGLTVSDLKSRLDGKKKIKGALLTPQEMIDLTGPWRPYRSLGVYFMWSLADG